MALDVKKGPHWTEAEVETFFKLLLRLVSIGQGSYLKLQNYTLEEVVSQFDSTWQKYLENEG